MTKKKQKKNAQQVFLSPEKYIKQKARSLKIKECYITHDFDTVGIGHVIVAREHTGGRITLGAYFVDKFCLGVKDSYYRLRMDYSEYEEYLDRLDMVGIKKISYEEAHNIIYGAIEFAEEAGIKPHKSFALTQYILEEDTEDIPLIEYEFGKDGKHYLAANSMLEASKYLPTLRKTLGENFDLCIGDDGDEYDDGEYDFSKMIDDNPLFKTYGPNTEYAYKHPEYPSAIELENPVVEDILCAPEYAISLPHDKIDILLALPKESLRHDLEQLILYHIGLGCDGIPEEISKADFVGVICTAVILLAEVGNGDSSLDVVLEVLRQSGDFYEYHICDSGPEALVPTLYKLGKDRLNKLMAFMKEEGLYTYAKGKVSDAVAFILQKHPERRSEIIEWFRELVVFTTEKLPETQYIDSTLAGIITNSLMNIKAVELIPEIDAMFDTGLVNEGYCGKHGGVLRKITCKGENSPEQYLTDVYERFDDMKKRFG